MAKSVFIVFTTINHPILLNDIYNNLNKYGQLNNVTTVVVGDKKTPQSVVELVNEVNARGLKSVYLDIPAQEEWGRRFPDFYARIPYNNETRRNIGYLYAFENGCDIMISIDDDNFPMQDDFISMHSIVGENYSGYKLAEENGYHNICEYLETVPDRYIYPRGFPFKLRGIHKNNSKQILADEIKIGVNAGLWCLEPDVDATTWINGKITATKYLGNGNYVLDQNTWSPVNTQNTAVLRDLIPAYFCIPMGWDVPGGKIQRYGDIWGGYFLQAIIKGTKYHVAFGDPVVEHRRNPHDYVEDLRAEFWGMMLTDWLVEMLQSSFTPDSSGINDRVYELSEFINEISFKMPKWCPSEMTNFMQNTSENLKHWADAYRLMGV